jgi:hypothetical protein
MYEYLLLATDPAVHGLPAFRDAVTAVYASHAAPRHPELTLLHGTDGFDQLVIRLDRFEFHVDWQCGASVREESAEIAADLALAAAERERIAAAGCRYEITSGDDPDLDYSRDLDFLLEAAESLPGVVIFDSTTGELVRDEATSGDPSS